MDQTDIDIGKRPPPTRRRSIITGGLAAVGLAALLALGACSGSGSEADAQAPAAAANVKADSADQAKPKGDVADQFGNQLIAEGRETFRQDTFGSEHFFGDVIQLHDAIQGEKHGGVGDGVSPATALEVGLKVDVEALPKPLQSDLAKGKVDLTSPDTTLALLQLDAVVGVDGQFDDEGNLKTLGVTCALCHSTVDDSFAPGIGHRLDGWANRDLNVGVILSLAPNLQPVGDMLGVDVDTVKKVLTSWGPGEFDASLLMDGKAFRPDGKPASVLIPPAYGLAGVNLATWTGWGSVTHWNAFVGNLEMHGQGTFYDPRLADPEQFPVAAAQGFDNVRPATPEDDLITSKLAALHVYQLAIPAPEAPAGSFDAEAAKRGGEIFAAKAACATCHVAPLFTEPGFNAHTPEEMGIDSFQADRSPIRMYRTAPLAGLWSRGERGYYHDGRFATLEDVVNHYDQTRQLGLSEDEKSDLVEYIKSL